MGWFIGFTGWSKVNFRGFSSSHVLVTETQSKEEVGEGGSPGEEKLKNE